jgi:hypothetical protein
MRFIPISDFEKDNGLTFRPIEDFEVRDTGDEAERLAMRYKAPEPLPPEPQGLISRAFDAVRGTVSSIPAAITEKFTPYKSVMETYQPTVEEQQAELNKRLSYGAGPVSLQTVAKADEMRRGMIPIEQGPVLTVAKAREQAKETSFFDLVDKAKEAETFERDAETLRRQRFGEENPLTGAFASGAASTLTGVINIPTVAAQLFNEYTVNPLLQLAGLKPLPKTDVMFGTEYLTKTAADYMPKINSRSIDGAIAREEFGKWLGVKLAANAQSSASSMAALFVPALRATLIPTMSSTVAGQSYAGGEPAMIAAAKGLIEAGTEMLPLKVFDKIGDALKGLSPLKQSSVLAVAGQRLLQAGGQVTAISLTNAIEETAAQFGGNVLDKYFQGKDIELTKGLKEAAVVGAVSGALITSPQTAGVLTGRYEPQNQIAQAINENVANTQFTGIDELARQQLSPFSNAPTNLNIGKINVEPVDTSTIFTAIDASSAAAAAAELAGGIPTVNLPPINLQPLDLPGQIEPALTGLALPPLPPAVEPALTDLALPPLPPAVEPALDLNAPLQPDVATEQQFGLDKLRLTPPRPQKIQGQPVTSLTDDQLTTIAGDETIPAITRRSASVELTARQNEAAGTTLATGLETAPSVPLANAPTEQNAGITADRTLALPESQVPSTAIAPVGGESAAAGARATAQIAIDRWATANNVETPAVFNAAPAELDSAVNQIGEALNSQFGGKLYAYIDPRPNSLNGVAIGGAAFVNTANVDVNVARTSIHEFHHTVEQIAKLEARQGLVDTPAQQYVASVNTVFDDMTEDGKRSYLVKFLNAEELAGIADPVAKEQRIQDLMASPTTRSEMVADFLGNRSTDKEFWKDLAATDPKGFKGFVDKWLGIVDNMLSVLKGTPTQGQKESALVDTYIRDLGKAKVVARDALIAYSKGTLNADTTGTQGIPELAASNRSIFGTARSSESPEYGTAREGAVSVVAQHFSTQPRTSLNGAYYGTGLKGAERDRLDGSPDPRLKNRVYFYVDQGAGVRPEAGVGGVAHEAKLNNIYDPETKLIPPKGSFNAFESAVINAGFDGYLAPFGNNQSAVVLLGPRHSAVPVRSLGSLAGAPAPTPAEPTTLKKGLLSKELAAIEASRVPGARVAAGNLEIPVASRDAANVELERIGSDVRFSKKTAPARVMFEVAPDPNNTELTARWDAVPFERKIEISQRVAEKIMPQVFKLAGVRAKMTTQLGGYLEKTSPSFAAIVPSTASAQQLMDVARLGGFGLAQDSMMVLDLKPFEGSFPTGLITITLPENMVDQKSVDAVYQDLRQVSPENISGHTTVGQEMVLAVPSASMDDLASKINGVLSSRPESFNLKTVEGHMAFPSKEEYDYGQAGEGTPELLAKRTEARRIREEASAAIEGELAKDESTGGRKIDTGVYRSVADAFGLSQAEYNASALPLMLGGVKGKTFRAPNIGGIPETIQWLDQRYRDSGMPTLDINKDEDRSTLARMLAAEAVGAIRSAGNAVEWYDETVAKTLRIMSVKYPELDTDPNARNAFLIAVAVASQTMNVEANLTYASSQYEAFRETGKFPEVGKGKSAPAMAKNFALANDVMADMGPDLLRRFLQTEFTKRELESIGFPIGSESMDEKMLGSAIFGPKIGFGFYSNLTGNFEPITMDMWFMRTIGRLSGTLPAFDPVLFPKQVAKLRAALAETGDSSRGIYAADFKPEDVAAAQQTDEGAIALARKIYSLHNRQFSKERAAFDSGARVKTALVNASNGIIKSADKPTDSPSSGGERQRLRDVTRQLVAMVEEQTGKRVPPAALQALIWYPEQELYKKLGVDLQVTSQDYAGAAELLLTKEGFDGKRISTAAESGPRPTRQVAGESVAGTNKQAGQPSGPAGPIQGEERETFIGNRIPLKDIFAGLEKRGLAKANTEAMIARRSDAAQIQYMQDNFLDILDELDTAGLVEINC